MSFGMSNVKQCLKTYTKFHFQPCIIQKAIFQIEMIYSEAKFSISCYILANFKFKIYVEYMATKDLECFNDMNFYLNRKVHEMTTFISIINTEGMFGST